mmetsp:Transcript_11914/g.19181  ORF Transcript_11914/g.19181 Transcript_11914/m.19181 type:complete len:209 (-) Transcript_11914:125-751(-)
MVLIDECFVHYFSDHQTLRNVRQFFCDLVNCINICFIHNHHINVFSQIIYFCVYYFTIYVGLTLYIISRVITLIFPVFYLINANQTKLALEAQSLSLPIVLTYLYFVFVVLLIFVYFIKYRRIIKIIWYLVPGYYGKNSLYVRAIANYHHNLDLQQFVYQSIVWYYQSHKNAPLISTYLCRKFGVDITSVIALYLPCNYSQFTEISDS